MPDLNCSVHSAKYSSTLKCTIRLINLAQICRLHCLCCTWHIGLSIVCIVSNVLRQALYKIQLNYNLLFMASVTFTKHKMVLWKRQVSSFSLVASGFGGLIQLLPLWWVPRPWFLICEKWRCLIFRHHWILWKRKCGFLYVEVECGRQTSSFWLFVPSRLSICSIFQLFGIF